MLRNVASLLSAELRFATLFMAIIWFCMAFRSVHCFTSQTDEDVGAKRRHKSLSNKTTQSESKRWASAGPSGSTLSHRTKCYPPGRHQPHPESQSRTGPETRDNTAGMSSSSQLHFLSCDLQKCYFYSEVTSTNISLYNNYLVSYINIFEHRFHSGFM